MSLDDKLKEIIESVQLGKLSSKKPGEATDWGYDSAAAQIKQCFLEQGWKEPDEQDSNA